MISEVKSSLNLNSPPPMDRAKADPPPVEGSTDVHQGKATARISYPMHGHALNASAAGKSASIPISAHKLGIEPNKGSKFDSKA